MVLVVWSWTYNPPRAKTAMRANFCFLGNCSDFRTGIGYMRMRISVRMWMAELENHRAFLSRQKPGTVGSQNLARGTQFAQALTMVQVP